MLIALSGYAGSGKDTVGRFLVEDFGFTRISFGDKVREFALKVDPLVNEDTRLSQFVDIFGWDGAKQFPEIRRLLQNIGTEAAQTVFWPSVWADSVFKTLTTKLLGENHYVITDFRFPHEAPGIITRGGYTVLVQRVGVGPINEHKSETALIDGGWVFDDVVKNDQDLAGLRLEVKDMLENIHTSRENY